MPPYSGVSLVLSRQMGSKVRHSVKKLSEAQIQLTLPAKANCFRPGINNGPPSIGRHWLHRICCCEPQISPRSTLVQARRPLRLSSVTSDDIWGGTHGAWIDLDIPTCDRVSGQWMWCPRIFVYSAGITDTLIFGLPFFCAFYPAQFPTKNRKIGSFTQTLAITQLPSTIQVQSIHTEGVPFNTPGVSRCTRRPGRGHVQELHQRGSPEIGI